MSKTTLDLSTLSDITDGAHTIKVKAKASGYNDSEFSNEVSYTKTSAPPVYTVTISNGCSFLGVGSLTGIYYINEAGERTLLPITNDNFDTYRGKTFKASSIDDLSGDYKCASITINRTEYYNQSYPSSHNLPLNLTSDATITELYVVAK